MQGDNPGLLPTTPEEHPDNNPPLYFTINDHEQAFPVTPSRVIQGGLSRVYVCPMGNPNPWGKPVVAMKRPREWIESDDLSNFKAVYTREAYLWQALGSHPAILELVDVSMRWDVPTLITEFMPATLRERLKRPSNMTPLEIAGTGLAISAALAYALERLRDFSHGDVKPENILFDVSDAPMLADFGLSSAITSAGNLTLPISSGTTIYMAPEVLLAAPSDAASDMYSLGLTLFEMLAGQVAFPWTGDMASYAQSRQKSPWDRLDTDAEPALVSLLEGLLEKRPADRLQSREVVAELSRFVGERGVELPSWLAKSSVSAKPSGYELVALAMNFLRLNAMDDARVCVEDALASSTDREELREAQHAASSLAATAGDSEQARKFLSDAREGIELAPREAQAKHYRFVAQWELHGEGRGTEAIAAARKSIELFSGDSETRFILGMSLSLAGQAGGEYEEALCELEKAVEVSTLVERYNFLVFMCLKAGQPIRALHHATQCIRLNPTSGWAHGLRVYVFTMVGIRGELDRETISDDATWAMNDPSTPPHIRQIVEAQPFVIIDRVI